MRTTKLQTFHNITTRMASIMGRRDRVRVSFGGPIAFANKEGVGLHDQFGLAAAGRPAGVDVLPHDQAGEERGGAGLVEVEVRVRDDRGGVLGVLVVSAFDLPPDLVEHLLGGDAEVEELGELLQLGGLLPVPLHSTEEFGDDPADQDRVRVLRFRKPLLVLPRAHIVGGS